MFTDAANHQPINSKLPRDTLDETSNLTEAKGLTGHRLRHCGKEYQQRPHLSAGD